MSRNDLLSSIHFSLVDLQGEIVHKFHSTTRLKTFGGRGGTSCNIPSVHQPPGPQSLEAAHAVPAEDPDFGRSAHRLVNETGDTEAVKAAEQVEAMVYRVENASLHTSEHPQCLLCQYNSSCSLGCRHLYISQHLLHKCIRSFSGASSTLVGFFLMACMAMCSAATGCR